MKQLSRFALHVRDWKDCTLCYLHEGRNRIVLAKGKLPCDILLLGEAPGESENVLGVPFVGVAGKLLDHIISRAIGEEGRLRFRLAYANLIACIPREDGGKASEPPAESIEACKPRLEDLIEIANPRLVVCVGKHSTEWTEPGFTHSIALPKKVRRVSIDHPSYILRANVIQKGLLIQKASVVIGNAVEELE